MASGKHNGGAREEQAGHGSEVANGRRPPPHATAAIAAERRAAAEELIAKLQRDGEVVIKDAGADERDSMRRVIDFAKRHALVPEGLRIEKNHRRNGDIHVRLLSGTHFNAKPRHEGDRVAVPDAVDEWHPLLAALNEPGDVLGISTDSLPRAMRIMHALLVEAERRGYEVGWDADTARDVEIRIDGFAQAVTIEEELDRREVLPSASELDYTKLYDWQRIRPQVKKVPSGKLAMSVTDLWGLRTHRRWADRKRWSLEDRLGDVLATVEDGARDKAERKRAEEEENAARQCAWREAMGSARTAFLRDRRIEALSRQLESWEQAQHIRAFCQAARRTGVADPEWLAWADAYADEIDPLSGRVTAPDDIEPRPEDLRAYLGRWSPYCPERR